MAILTVGPNSSFPTIADAMAAAAASDTMLLETGYGNETATVTHSGMTVSGDATSTGIILQLGTGIATFFLAGTAPIDVLDATDGNGIVGNDGDNVITVTGGADAVSGGLGTDRLVVDYRLTSGAITGNSTTNFADAGGLGIVTVVGGFEHFTVLAGSGADTITTGAGDDIINTGEGASTVVAGAGANRITGGSGADTVTALDGGNFIDGGGGDNTLTSGGGNDEITGGLGVDTIVAGGGDDLITVTGGADTSNSGAGNDRLIVNYSTFNTAVTGGVTGGDLVSGYSGHIADLAGNSIDFLTTENFTVTTGSGDDNITTGDGDDVLDGGAGSDQLDGGGGSDTLLAGVGDDTLDGGANSDSVRFSGARANYQVNNLGNGVIQTIDLRSGLPDGTDTLTNMEGFVFTDGTFDATAVLNDPPTLGGDLAIAVANGGTVIVTAADLTATDSDNTNAQLVYTVTGASHGTVLLAGIAATTFTEADILANTVSFQHDGSAIDGSFTVSLTDGTAVAQVATVIATAGNAAPSATNDALSAVAEDSGQRTILGSTLTGNDSAGPASESGQTLIVTAVSNVIGGSASVSGGNVLFTPTANFNGAASFDYTVTDNGTTSGVADPLTATATASFTVTEVNDTPSATNDALSAVAEDSGQRTILGSSLTGNDSVGPVSESGQTLTVTAVTNVIGGSASVSGGNVLFTPTANFNGAASFDYTVTDNGTTNGTSTPLTATASASFAVTEVNDAPSAANDALSAVGEDSGQRTILGSSLTGNDSAGPVSESGQTLTITAVSNVIGGSASVSGGNVLFTPTANFNGAASFDYTVTDNGTTNGVADPLTATATVSFTVTEVNDTPSATNDALSAVAEDSGQRTILGSTLTGNDSAGPSGESGQTLTVTAVTNVIGGSASVSGGNVLFIPTANFNGAASFDYTVTDNGTTNGVADPQTATATASFTVTEVNDAPSAANDALSAVAEDSGQRTILGSSLTSNDSAGPSGESGQTLTVTAVSNVIGGSASVSGGNVLFTPTANFNGAASFDYTVTDNGTTNGGADPQTATATASFTVTEVNDAPSAANDALSAVAEDGGQRTILGSSLTGNDSSGPSGESGQTLTVTGVTNVIGGSASVSGGNVLFTPTANFNGAASFDYTVTDNGTTNGVADPQTATATASFAVTEVNDAPSAANDALSAVAEDSGQRTILGSSLTGNDSSGPSGESGQTLTVTAVTNVIGGSASVSGGNVLFTPTANFNGAASFDYTVTDDGTTNGTSAPLTAMATASFTVTEVDDAPTLGGDLAVAVANGGTVIVSAADLTATDPDNTNAELVYTVTGTLHGAVLLAGIAAASFTQADILANTVSFQHDGSATSGNFTVSLTDGTALPQSATVTAAVPGNAAPTITSNGGGANAIVPVAENTSAVTTVTASDPDAGTTLGYSIVGGADAAMFAINGSTGALSFLTSPDFATPGDADHDNSYLVQVRASDGSLSDDQAITVNVTDGAAAPANPFDFNGDGKGDILLQNTDGTPAVWLMDGTGVATMGPPLSNPGPSWHAIGSADFNGDSKADILWQNTDGTAAVWLMDGTGVISTGHALSNPGPTWHTKEAADFNGDGKADILWQNDNGTAGVWLMDGTSVLQTGGALANPGPSWHTKAAADFNGDGKADILWQDDNGTTGVWLMDGVNVLQTGGALPNADPAWHAQAAGDFNGDGKADILWQHDNGTAGVWLMDGTNVLQMGGALANPGPSWHVKEAVDTNADGKADILWQNDNGTPGVWLMDGTSVLQTGGALPNSDPAWHVI